MPVARAVLARVPGAELFDAHVHVGINDPAGLLATEEEALAALDEVSARALVFALKEPDGYREANERMVRIAAGRPGTPRWRAWIRPRGRSRRPSAAWRSAPPA